MSEERRTAFVVGDWTIEPELNLLRREDEERRIEPKVMKVLLTLASQQSHVFSKEALISAVWPDTFVSDDVLTRCISILRRITDDDPHAPRFIQTVPKVGYRLVAPISELPPPLDPTIAQDEVAPELSSETSENIPTKVAQEHTEAASVPNPERASTKPSLRYPNKLWIIISLTAVILVAGAIWTTRLWKTHISSQDDAYFRTVPFTSFAGEQTEPAFSPDGQSIAFVRLAEDGNSRRICIKRIGSENMQELTHDKDEQFSPAWSPDGRQIAYFARSESGLGLYIADVVSGKLPRRVFIPQEPSHWELGALSWSPDGKSLIFPDHTGTESNSSIFRLDLDSLRVQSITSPPAGWEGDLTPAYSPNGKYVAFSRASETAVRDIYWISLADGQLHQLTHDRMSIDGLAWSRDSSSILFSSNRGGKYSLWKIGIYGKEPVRLPVGTEDASQPTVGPYPGQLAYTEGSAIWGINRIESGTGFKEDVVLSSTQQDSAPSLSPDAKSFAFQSLRSGNQEIWIASVNGDTLRQLTSMNGPLAGSPSWSHKGDQILFDSRPDGHSHIFSIPAVGGRPIQITFGNVNDIIPRWSLDDQTVFFRSNRGGRWQIWKVSIHGGQPQPVTTDDGIVPQESADGKWLYYTRGDESGLWRVPLSGGDETMVLPQPAAGYWGYWQLTPLGIFYLDTSHTPISIQIFDPNSGQTRIFANLRQTPPQYQGISVTKDSKVLLITGKRNAERHITLVQGKP